jgi:hypothetical protein
MSTNASETATHPSTGLVNGLAWSFIALSAGSLLLAAVQYLLFAYVVQMEPLRATIADAINLKLLPRSAMAVVEHMPGIFMALFVTSLLTLLISIALLKRRNWARIAFVWITIATALLHIAGLLLPFYFMHDFSAALNDMPPELRAGVAPLMKVLSIVSIVMGIAFTGFFAWIARRLLSAEIRQEFVARDAPEESQ